MARTRKSKASVILQYFQTEELGVAQTVYDLVSQIMRERVPKAAKATKATKRNMSKMPTLASSADAAS